MRNKAMNSINKSNRDLSRTLDESELDLVVGGTDRTVSEIVTTAMKDRVHDLKTQFITTYGPLGSTYQF
jgi:hypothetical protein